MPELGPNIWISLETGEGKGGNQLPSGGLAGGLGQGLAKGT